MLLMKLSDVRKTAFDFERSNALTKLSVNVKWLHSILNDQMHWRFVCFVEVLRLNNCLLTQTRRLMLADVADWLTDCKTSYWLFDRNVNSLHLIVFSLTWLLNLIERNVDSYEIFKWDRLMLFRHKELDPRPRF